ncbi:MAG: aminodeoxychorismate synthase component I [Bacteroidota bacterium]
MSGEIIASFIERMNTLGASGEPFLFIIDAGMKKPEIHKLNDIPAGIKYATPLTSNSPDGQMYSKSISLKKAPVSFEKYSNAFLNVMKNIRQGNTYLLNLTFPTRIECNLTLEEIFRISVAKYKLLYYNTFVVFSPEIFVRIKDGMISSFPMKGTIDASVPHAREAILNDEKETAEHNTIVDLIRNDLSIVSNNVRVSRYRYVESLRTSENELLQVSSEITGELQPGYERRLGDIITGMLPAGSVTGAPKKRTVEIIEESEQYNRDWYTGVFGVFNGEQLDSAVMIRFIERDDKGLIYKSGGGITYMSDPAREYEEMIAKVYLPVG